MTVHGGPACPYNKSQGQDIRGGGILWEEEMILKWGKRLGTLLKC